MPRYMQRLALVYFWPVILIASLAIGIVVGLATFYTECRNLWRGAY